MTLDAFIARFRALPRAMKLGGLTVIAGVTIATTVTGIALHPARAPLFAEPLHPEQVAEVEERLAQWNVVFTPIAGNVIVDAAHRNDILLRLSLAGVPHVHVATTNEALASVGVLTPQAVVEAQTRVGLAGEIELALRSIDGVNDAHVIIAPAKVAEFADQSSSSATASVRLQLRPGAHLSRTSIAGIRSFVAASVSGLDPQRVTILDDSGVAIDAQPPGNDASALQASLQSALDDALGAGVAIVRVHIDYDTVEREVRDVRRAPLAAAPIAHESASESFDGQGRRYEKNAERDDRGSDTNEQVSRTPAGSLARVSTAIFVDAQRGVALASVRALAAATVGFDARRGDALTVQAVDFHRALASPRDGWFLLYGAIVPLLPTVAVVLGVLVAARSAAPHVRALIKRSLDRASISRLSSTVGGYSPSQVRGALAHEPPHAAAAIISALPAATAAAVLELYPQHEREAIVRRMQREHSPLIPDAAEMFVRHA
jgi:flagellar biosynthesis/type III secretory pathway M-ring protein FliF/YscJ